MENNSQQFHILRWAEIPDIGLYMDQVIKLINANFEPFADEFGMQRVTKNMINNYVKARIVKAPENKQYSRMSVAMVIVVYILKNCYSTENARKLIQRGINLDDSEVTYDRFCEAVEAAVRSVFSGEIEVRDVKITGRDNKYLMENFALSLACKFYVQSEFINKLEGKK